MSPTASGSAVSTPKVDPDAPLIAYQTNRGGSEGVWLIQADGAGDVKLETGTPGEALLPDWSHDGRRIVFTSRGGAKEPLFVYDLKAKTSTQLFACDNPCFGDDEPAYSPDDSQVAFVRALGPLVNDAPSDCGLWIGDVATGKVRQVTSQKGCDPRVTQPRWSPDGTRLTYWTERYDAAGAITGTAVFVIGADGGGKKRLTEWEDFTGDPDWSPDGKWIVFDTHPLRNFQCCQVSNLERIHPDGTGRERLTNFADETTRATQPRYTPDGTQILFTLVRANRLLALMPAEGGDFTKVSTSGIYTHGTMQPKP